MDEQRRSALKMMTGICAAAALPAAAWAQKTSYPGDTVTMIVPYGAGGSTDYFARVVATDLGSRHNGRFIVENRAGAAGNIGTRYVAISPPDGRTLLYSTATPFSINPYIYRSLPYDPDGDFVPVALTVQVPLVLVASKELGVNTLQELIDYLRKNEKTSSYSSYGVGTSSHISNAVFVQKIGAPGVLHVPYKDNRAMPDLAANRNTFQVDAWTTVAPLVSAGKLVVLGVCASERMPWIPDVPTIASVIKQDYDMSTWHAIFAPKSTPTEILDFLNREVRITMEKESIQQSAIKQGFVGYPHMSREQVAKFVHSDKQRWQDFVKIAGIEPA